MPKRFQWAEVGLPAGWVGDGNLAELLGHPCKRGLARGGGLLKNTSPALEEFGRLAVLTSMNTALPERHTSPDDLSTSTYLLDLCHD